jgi:hypothetical protein
MPLVVYVYPAALPCERQRTPPALHIAAESRFMSQRYGRDWRGCKVSQDASRQVSPVKVCAPTGKAGPPAPTLSCSLPSPKFAVTAGPGTGCVENAPCAASRVRDAHTLLPTRTSWVRGDPLKPPSSQAWHNAPIVPATQEAEAGGSLEPSSVDSIARPPSQKQKTKPPLLDSP